MKKDCVNAGNMLYSTGAKAVDHKDKGDRACVEAGERRRHVCASRYSDGFSVVAEAGVEAGAGAVGEGERQTIVRNACRHYI